MDAHVIALTLFAAVLHATWNALAHGVKDRLVGFALIGLAYVGAGGAGALLLGLPPAAAWPYVVTSAAVHVVYVLLLWASYELGDFSQSYPIARGTAPWLVAVVEVALGHRLPLVQAAGILVVTLGLLSLARGGRRDRRAVGAAVATGVAIAAYTVIDATAVQVSPVPVYAAWMFLLQGPVLPVIALIRRRRELQTTGLGTVAIGVGGGLVSLVAYGLVLVAQTSGATAAIAALRETSIVIGALIGAVFFQEGLGARRAVAAGIVVAGIVLVSF
ncbi:EamA family transporter [Dactylosporangium sp. CS-033363]|uniref:EamA family transporter n=1 Tax=Dactylosporangium sp. CS-033363 TaxID=3239935 RepID=UPI003D8E2B4B